MTHEQQIKLDMDLYGNAFERLLPDGTKERIDPTTIRVIKPTKEEPIIKFGLFGNPQDYTPEHYE